MAEIRFASASDPFRSQALARQAVGVISTAEAMGLLEGKEMTRLDLDSFREVVERIAEAGIGSEIQAALTLPGESPGEREMGRMLERLAEAMEASPSPAHEWPALEALFGAERLAELVGISPISLRRYRAGSRTTPDRIASRLHFLATVVGDLSGSYNKIGIRQWFERPRQLLDGAAPGDLLRGDWEGNEEGPRRVRALARSLTSSAAT